MISMFLKLDLILNSHYDDLYERKYIENSEKRMLPHI